MPIVNVAKIRQEAEAVNNRLGRFMASSLDPLLKELAAAPGGNLDPQRAARVQELVLNIPHDRQQKYKTALDLLASAGIRAGARPSDPSMEFVRFDTGPFAYVGLGPKGAQQMVTLDPGSLHHVFDFRWKSSNGNMASLAQVRTREHVHFRSSQRAAPFNDAMPTDIDFYWGESMGATGGFGRDDHSIKPPRLVCRHPWTAGENVAEQWYQYSIDNGQTFHNIPGAAYLLTKGVRQSGGKWVFFFRKSNWAPHNTKRYCFEAEYEIGAPLSHPPKPDQKWNRTNGTEADLSKYGRLISRG